MAENEVRPEGLGYHVQSYPPVGNETEFAYVTAKTFPLGDDGKFQSEPAEACYEQAKVFGLTRDQTRLVIQAYQCKMDECDRKYEEWVAAGRPRR
jgi:hypothetical protein